jgi:hypothetical protein
MRQNLCAKSHARNLAAAGEIHEAQSWRLDAETEAEEEGRWLAGFAFPTLDAWAPRTDRTRWARQYLFERLWVFPIGVSLPGGLS